MANEQIPVKHNVTGDETTMPVEALDAWAERGWHPIDEDWRTKYGVEAPSQALSPQVFDADGNPVELPAPPPAPPG